MRFLIFFLIILFSGTSYSVDCKSGEFLVARCSLSEKDKRVASICYKSGKKDSLTYYFQRNNHIELEVIFSDGEKLKRWIDRATYTTYFGFSRGDYSYVIGVPEEKPNAVAFLDIKKRGVILNTHNCLTNSFGKKNIKHPYIEDIADNIVRANNFLFP
jgi:hypothetical protein